MGDKRTPGVLMLVAAQQEVAEKGEVPQITPIWRRNNTKKTVWKAECHHTLKVKE